jgi:CHASE1-domain containing sensor protein
MIEMIEKGNIRPLSPFARFLYSRYLQYAGALLSVIVLFAVWYLSDRYFHGTAQRDFGFHASEHLELLKDRVHEHNRPPLEAVARITAHRDDFFLEITDSRGAVLYRSPDFAAYPSEYVVEKKTSVSGEEWRLLYTSSRSYDAAHKSFYPILFALGGMAVQLFLLYSSKGAVRGSVRSSTPRWTGYTS